MARDSSSYAPLQFLADDADIRAKTTTVLSHAAIIPALTPMKRDAANKLIPATAVGDKIVGLSMPTKTEAETLTGWTVLNVDHSGSVYISGSFFADKINFAAVAAITGDTAADRLKKDALFDNTGITINFTGAGSATSLLD